MKINQNKENVFTKGLDNTEATILAIMKRFFELNPEGIYGSIDYIVNEVLTTIKEELLNGTLIASVTSVNNKTGIVVLNADDVGAEPAIIKNTAFNKNFGNSEDTVCQGNDPRLSDKREPIEHEHEDYLTTVDVDSAIESFLKRKGITFTSDGMNVSGNLNIKNGEITEE